MAALELIGYHTLLTSHPQSIQGEYRVDLNDPMYAQSFMESLIPFDGSIYMPNTEWDPMRGHGEIECSEKYLCNEDLLSSKKMSKEMKGSGSRRLWHRVEEQAEDAVKASEPDLRDIRMGGKQMRDKVESSIQRMRKKVVKSKRPDLPVYRMKRGAGEQLPASKLKKRLMKGNGFERRTQVKDLLKRLK